MKCHISIIRQNRFNSTLAQRIQYHWWTTGNQRRPWCEWDCLLIVTCNDISVINVTTHRCAGRLKKKLDLRSGSQRHMQFVGFFNVPSKHRHGANLFIRLFRETALFSRLLRQAEDTEDTLSTTPRVPTCLGEHYILRRKWHWEWHRQCFINFHIQRCIEIPRNTHDCETSF